MKTHTTKGHRGNVVLAIAVIVALVGLAIYGGGLMASSGYKSAGETITVTDITRDGDLITAHEIFTADSAVSAELAKSAFPRTVRVEVKEIEDATRRHVSRLIVETLLPEGPAEKPAKRPWYKW